MNHSHPPDDLSPAESNLGKLLVLIHRVLPRLDDPARKAEVQSALNKAASLLEAARAAHSGGVASLPPIGSQQVATAVAPEIAAVIAAAVAVVLDRPYRLVSVQQVTVPVVPHLNVWAVEGRTQIFMSHKVR
ncbi:MAG: hypothetical protein KJ070_04035 [Verrucomicrobia bacterium]|nr:hypothetical protein [Verrucomicrobiota bacterium]